MKLELDRGEREALASALQSYLSDLSVEIADTDTREYRERLKAERQILSGILERVRAESA